MTKKIINVYYNRDSRAVKIAGAFTKERALGHAKRIAGPGAKLAQRGDELGYSGGHPGWIYIRLSEVPSV